MMQKVLIPLTLAFFFAAVLPHSEKINATEASASTDRPVKRKILALYDGSITTEPAFTAIHKLAEMPLNHLGYDVRYRDATKDLPTPEELTDYRGILTWFSGPLKNGDEYLKWAEKTAATDIKFVVFSDLGVRVTSQNHAAINRFLSKIGLRLNNTFVSETFGTRVLNVDKTIVGFERPLFSVIPPYSVYLPNAPQLESHLLVQSPRHAQSGPAVLIATSPGGGFVHSGFSIIYEPALDRENWLLNPFAFFKKAFGNETFPIPDTTTLSGRRIYFSHVDGDGWNNVSMIEHYQETATLSAQVMLTELIEPYPDLPVTVGLVTGDLDASIGGNPEGADIARKIYALAHVEVGSHTHTHPFNWQYFKTYDRAHEIKLLEGEANAKRDNKKNVFNGLADIASRQTPREQHAKYIADSDTLPRAYLKKPFDLDQEIPGSLKLAQSFAPNGKKAMLMQWSGNTQPFPAAIRATRTAGVRNINGGDPRFDRQFSSHAYLSPLSRMIGQERQVYAAASNENTYTNDWTGPYYAFSHLTGTLRNTDLPRRLKPFNLYYHTYSAERDASLRAVKSHLDRASKGSFTPIPASHYAAIADSFFQLEITVAAPNVWAIRNRGELQTLRFDNASNLNLDWRKSTGVLGTSRHGNALYIALDASVNTPLIAIEHTGQTDASAIPAPNRPSLHDSRWQIEHLRLSTCQVRFAAHGFGHGQMLWHGVSPGSYEVRAARLGNTLWTGTTTVNDDGKLKLTIPVNAIEPIDISFKCQNRPHASNKDANFKTPRANQENPATKNTGQDNTGEAR